MTEAGSLRTLSIRYPALQFEAARAAVLRNGAHNTVAVISLRPLSSGNLHLSDSATPSVFTGDFKLTTRSHSGRFELARCGLLLYSAGVEKCCSALGQNRPRWGVRFSEGNIMAIIGNLLRGTAVSVIALAGAAAYADAPPAVAFEHTSIVRFADLNLDHPRDVARLYNRIALVADKVCGPRSLTGSYSKSAIYASCYADTVAEAVARVDQPALTAYFRQRAEPALRPATIAQR